MVLMTAVAASLLMAFQDVSERLGQSFGTQHGQPLLQRLPARFVEAIKPGAAESTDAKQQVELNPFH
jgi:hypothetical protein